MGFWPLGPYTVVSSKSSQPSVNSLRKIFRGNMIPVWKFLITRVKSEKTVENIRRNIMVHGGGGGGGDGGAPMSLGKEEDRSRGGRQKEKVLGESSSAAETKEMSSLERDMAEKEVEKLRNILRRQRKYLKAKMLEHKHVMLEAYDQQCDEVAKIFTEYHKRLHFYVIQARDAQRSSVDSSTEVVTSYSGNNEKEAVGKSVITVNFLKSLPLLLQAITAHTSRLKSLISREIEKIDVRADAETFRYKYESNQVIDVSSPNVSSPVHYQLYGNGKMGIDVPSKGSQNQLLERQKAHVQQFFATEDALNKATEARNVYEKLIKHLQGSGNVAPTSLGVGGTSQNVGSFRQFELPFILTLLLDFQLWTSKNLPLLSCTTVLVSSYRRFIFHHLLTLLEFSFLVYINKLDTLAPMNSSMYILVVDIYWTGPKVLNGLDLESMRITHGDDTCMIDRGQNILNLFFLSHLVSNQFSILMLQWIKSLRIGFFLRMQAILIIIFLLPRMFHMSIHSSDNSYTKCLLRFYCSESHIESLILSHKSPIAIASRFCR
ncbi:hypothetical protein UlMin_032967 [Ulmus minor]